MTNSAANPTQRAHGYQRAYKACYSCRKRKGRCEKDPQWNPGAPCKRCKREMRDCVFPIERADSRKATATTVPARFEPPEASTTMVAPDTSAVPPVRSHCQPSTNYVQSESELPTSPIFSGDHAGLSGFSSSMMRTVISTGNDALAALFEPVGDGHTPSSSHVATGPAPATESTTFPPGRVPVIEAMEKWPVHELWNVCRFVKQGWFSPNEALFLVDMFYSNIQKLAPIVTDYYSKHENHYQLLSSEPLLCSTILLISSRYHALPGEGGMMRSYYIHERLWTHCQHLIQRVLLGQEKLSAAKLRTVGTVEALLLLTEWHPRSMSFPPPIDGWDSDLLMHWSHEQNPVPDSTPGEARGRWLRDVIIPTRKSVRMSWMLTNCAMSLASELGILGDSKPGTEQQQQQQQRSRLLPRARQTTPTQHLPSLLYLYSEQASLQLGCQSLVPPGLSRRVPHKLPASAVGGYDELQTCIAAWIALTRLTKAMMEALFPSNVERAQLLHRARYLDLVDYFDPMLSAWREEHLDNPHCVLADCSRKVLLIEYYSARLSCHSLVIQAIIDRASTQQQQSSPCQTYFAHGIADEADYSLLEEVVNCAMAILNLISELSDQGILMFAPARVTLRAISASVFLLKGLGIGVTGSKLQESLSVLRRAISCLQGSTVDELQFSGRYATLLDMHLSQLEKSFVASSYPPYLVTRSQANDVVSGGRHSAAATAPDNLDYNVDDWLSLPYNPAFASLDMGDSQGYALLDEGELDFLWSLDGTVDGDLATMGQ